MHPAIERRDPTTTSTRTWRSCAGSALATMMALVLLLGRTAAAHAQQFGEWQPAVSADPGGLNGVNTPFNDGCPYEAPDGHMLFIASNRPGTLGANDVWVSVRASEDADWGAPVNLMTPVNSAANDFCPTPLPGSRLLFVSARANTCGGAANDPDIYSTRLHPVRGWLPPEHLGCEVNSGFEEFSPSLVEANGLAMLFFSSSRGDGVNHDIYVSTRQVDGSWGPATPVSELNSAAHDSRPNVRKDGLEIVFDSTRDGLPGGPEIYTATRASVFEPWSMPQRLGTNVNSDAAETRAALSRDGKRLYFGSTRAGGQGSTDIYVSTRSGPGDE